MSVGSAVQSASLYESRKVIYMGVQLLVSTIFALYAVFVGQAMYDGLRNRVHFKPFEVTAGEVLGVIAVGVVVMSYGHHGAIGAGIVIGGLAALGSMNLIYATAEPRRPQPRIASARRTM